MQFYGRGRDARQVFRQGKRAFFRKEFVYTYRQKQRFLRSKTLMQDSTREPKYNVFRACPAVKNQPIFTAFPVPRRRAKRGKLPALKAGARWSFVYTPGGKTSSCDIREGAQSAFPLSAWGTCRTPAALHPADKEETAPPDTPPPL